MIAHRANTLPVFVDVAMSRKVDPENASPLASRLGLAHVALELLVRGIVEVPDSPPGDTPCIAQVVVEDVAIVGCPDHLGQGRVGLIGDDDGVIPRRSRTRSNGWRDGWHLWLLRTGRHDQRKEEQENAPTGHPSPHVHPSRVEEARICCHE